MPYDKRVITKYTKNPNSDRCDLETREIYLINKKRIKHSQLELFASKTYNWPFNNKQFKIWSETINNWKINVDKSRIIESEHIPKTIHYTPDFIVNRWVIEIKGYNSHYIEYWALKEKLIKRFCYENNYKFITIRNKKELELWYNVYSGELNYEKGDKQ